MAQDFIAENEQVREEERKRFAQANEHWAHLTPESFSLDIEYDPEQDYLWVQIGERTETVAIHSDDLPVMILADAETYRWSGLECPFFMQRFKEGALTGKFWEVVVDLVAAGHTRIYIPEEKQRHEVERSLGDLVPA